MNKEDLVKQHVTTYPNFPKPGIQFRDVCGVLYYPEAFDACIDCLKHNIDTSLDKIVAMDARGFLFGSVLAKELNVPLVLARKKHKLPGMVIRAEYGLEYGTDSVEIQVDKIYSDDRIVIVDDLVASAGTALAVASLVEDLGAIPIQVLTVIGLPELGGIDKLRNKGIGVYTVCNFEGE